MRKALVIDDDPISCELVASILRSAGFDTFELPSPIGATKTILKKAIEVVVLDIMMPALSGDKLAKMLRASSEFDRLVIVLVSSCPREQLQRIAKEVNADAVVSKEDLRTALVPAIVRAVEVRNRAAV